MLENESDWLIRAKNHDVQAFTFLLEEYQRPVFNLCYRMLGNAQDAEDAAQETFLRAYQSIDRYDLSRRFSTWLLSIAAHYCIDQIRKRKVQVISVEDLQFPDLPEASPGIEINLGKKEEKQSILKLIAALDGIDRAAVIMYYWYDFSYEEICQALSLSMSALKSRLHRARRFMAEQWLSNQGESSMMTNSKTSHTEILQVERIAP